MLINLVSHIDGNLFCLEYLTDRQVIKHFYFSTAQASHFFALFVLKIETFSIINCETNEKIDLTNCKQFEMTHSTFLKLYRSLIYKIKTT